MKKSEFFTRLALVLIVIAAIVAIVLQIINEKTNAIETTYEIITFSVGITALIIAVLQGLDNTKTTRELHKMAREIRESIDELKDLSQDNDKLQQEISDAKKLDEEEIDLLKKILKD